MNNRVLTIMPASIRVEFATGSILSEVMNDAGFPVNTPCGGRGTCGKCGVLLSGTFADVTSPNNIKTTSESETRLSCRTILLGDSTVTVKTPSALTTGPSSRTAISHAGIAADIGTTGIQISFVDLDTGQILQTHSFLNPQRRYGHDVISRAAASQNPEASSRLSTLLLDSLKNTLNMFERGNFFSGEDIAAAVFSGNTSMSASLAGISFSGIGTYPYHAPALDFQLLSKSSAGLPESCEVSVHPAASAFIGGDITGGIAYLEKIGLPDKSFFFDIGTNGEMVLFSGGEFYAASCAMGPALEGMNISSGMTASDGAINRVTLADGKLNFSVIGGGEASGIAGSGIIDLMAILLQAGIISRDGAFARQAPAGAEEMFSRLNEGKFTLTENTGLTQKDIRAVQLAKGASLASAEMLLAECGISAEEISSVFVAGAFGENIDMESFRTLKLLPDFRNAEYITAGNTSLKSAIESLKDRAFRHRVKDIASRMTVIELSAKAEFNDLFLKSLSF